MKEETEFADDSEFGCIYSDLNNTQFKPNIIKKLPPTQLFQFYSNPLGGFPDIPEHQRYLLDCKFLDDTCYSNISAVVTEKYKDHAIVYLIEPARRPAVIFRCCIENFDDIELGTWLKVTANLLKLPFIEQEDRLFNLYCTNIKIDTAEFLPKSEVKDGIKVFLNDVHVIFTTSSKIKKCEKGWIFYADIGSILIRHEYSPMFNIRKGHFLGTLRSMIQGVGQNEYICWMLCPTFNVYRGKYQELHQKCIDGIFQEVLKKPRRQRPDRPRILQTAFEKYPSPDEKKEKEVPFVVIPTLPPQPQKNVGERLAEIFFNKNRRRFR